ncbi:DMT family transporter [Larkinella ripae]
MCYLCRARGGFPACWLRIFWRTTSPTMGTDSGRPAHEANVSVMSWIYLVIAGLLEVVWAYSMKQSNGFTRPLPTLITLVAMIASFGLLAVAMRTLPLGTAYTIWTGIGALGAFLLGIFFLGEPINSTRLLAAFLLLAGLVLMKLSATP